MATGTIIGAATAGGREGSHASKASAHAGVLLVVGMTLPTVAALIEATVSR